ncbi:MAG: Nif3-like dinuclear metal center hexameric protein [Arcobacteraceae bacterium]
MKIKAIYEFLNEISPFELQEKWDNSGLLVGNENDEIEKVYISLDLDEELLHQVEENSLIITHHPLIFSSLRRVNYDSFATKCLRTLIQKNIALICMHTNFDKTHLNAYVTKTILGLEPICSGEYVCYANVNSSFDDFFENICAKLQLEYKKCVKCHDTIKKVAVVTGAGMSMIESIDADCFLTGDIKYHDAIEAKSRGISLIDIGHYESERHFSPLLLEICNNYLKKNKIQAIMSNSENPFVFHL